MSYMRKNSKRVLNLNRGTMDIVTVLVAVAAVTVTVNTLVLFDVLLVESFFVELTSCVTTSVPWIAV